MRRLLAIALFASLGATACGYESEEPIVLSVYAQNQLDAAVIVSFVSSYESETYGEVFGVEIGAGFTELLTTYRTHSDAVPPPTVLLTDVQAVRTDGTSFAIPLDAFEEFAQPDGEYAVRVRIDSSFQD